MRKHGPTDDVIQAWAAFIAVWFHAYLPTTSCQSIELTPEAFLDMNRSIKALGGFLFF